MRSWTASMSALLSRFTGAHLPELVASEKFTLRDAESNTYIDLISGCYACIFGYSNPDIVETMAIAASNLPYAHDARFSNVHAKSISELLGNVLRLGDCRVCLSVSGSDAVELAIRIATLYQLSRGNNARRQICSLKYSYHGSTLGALAATGHYSARSDYAGYVPKSVRITPPILTGKKDRDQELVDLAKREIDTTFESAAGTCISACILEPVIGNSAGAVEIPHDYLHHLSRRCVDNDILLIGDEVTTGLWRTGQPLGFSDSGLTPDLIVIGKALTAGYFPMSAVLVSERVADSLYPTSPMLGHTHSGHPIGSRIAEHVIGRLTTPATLQNIQDLSKCLDSVSSEIVSLPHVSEFRGKGLLRSIVFKQEDSKGHHHGVTASLAYQSLLSNGILAMPGQCKDDFGRVISEHITIAPAYNIPKHFLQESLLKTCEAISNINPNK